MKSISIIIPVYNAFEYIRKCVDSIVMQEFNDYELIIIDDGSTDGTSEECDKIKEDYSNKNIIVFHKKNGGSASARNVGLSIAKGKYISFIDADDYISPFFFEIMYKVISETDADIVQCDYDIVYDDQYSFTKNTLDYVKKGREDVFENFCDRKYYVKTVVLWNKLYKRELFDGVIAREGKAIDDEYIILNLLEKCDLFVDINDKLYAYYQSENSQMRSPFSVKKIYDGIDLINYQIPILKRNVSEEVLAMYYYRTVRGLLDFKYFMRKKKIDEEIIKKEIDDKLNEYLPRVFSSKKNSVFEKMFLLIQVVFPGAIWRYKRGKLQ